MPAVIGELTAPLRLARAHPGGRPRHVGLHLECQRRMLDASLQMREGAASALSRMLQEATEKTLDEIVTTASSPLGKLLEAHSRGRTAGALSELRAPLKPPMGVRA